MTILLTVINHKKRWLLFVLVVITIVSPITTSKADYVVADWGDVVKLNVTLNYRFSSDPQPQFYYKKYIYLYLGESLPQEVNDSLANDDLRRDIETLFPLFREKIVGLKEGGETEFTVSYKDAGITNKSDPRYGAELIYKPVVFVEMLYDAKYEPVIEYGLDHPLVLAAAVTVTAITYISYKKGYWTSFGNKINNLFSPRCNNCKKPTKYHCGNPECGKRVCRDCFTNNNGCPFCGHNKLVIKK